MEEINISVSDSGSYKVDLAQEINHIQNQNILVALYGLMIISLVLAVYFFFTQEPAGAAHTSLSAYPHAEEVLVERQAPMRLHTGSRTLESETVDSEGRFETSRKEQVQNVLGKTVETESLPLSGETADDQVETVTENTVNDEARNIIELNQKPPAALTENEKRKQRNQVKLFCAKLGEKLGSVSVADCLEYDFQHSGVLSNEQTPIVYLDYAIDSSAARENTEDSDPIRVLLFGGIHGDEFSAVSIIFKWLQFLESEKASDSETKVQTKVQWRVVPVLNPDGLLQPHGQSKRMNANNVDLNRNFPTPDWENQAIKYWKEKTGENARRYPGVAPASEVETQWVLAQLDDYKPDAVISVHAPFGIVDADGPAEPPQKLGPLELKLLGTYPGSMGRYIGVHKNLPMLTVELERAGSMPHKDDIEHIWLDIQDWIDDKVQNRDQDSPAEMQSIRREESDDNGSTVIDQKAGD